MLGQLRYAPRPWGSAASRPALAGLVPPARLALHEGALRRFFLIVWHAMGRFGG